MEVKVSLIIPVKDEEDSISMLLESIKGQTYQPDEIVITNAGSKDRTVEIIESYIKKGMPIKIISVEHAYPGKARTIAIEAARNELIAMTDAGVVLDRNWLKELVRPVIEQNNVNVVYGHYEPILDSFFKKCLAIAFIAAPRNIDGKRIRAHFVASMLVKKKVWSSVGGFPDLRAAEDRIFMERIEKAKFCIAYSPDAKVFWSIPSDFKAVFKRFSLYSMHDIIAGRMQEWHYPVIAMYLLGGIIFLLGLLFSPIWFFLLFLAMFSRATVMIFEKSADKALSYKLDIIKIMLVAALIIWIDLAMFWGIARYFWKGIEESWLPA